MRNYKENLSLFKWLVILALVAYIFIGCTKPQEAKETLECRDGHLYSVSRQKIEIMLQDSCDKGKINMRDSK